MDVILLLICFFLCFRDDFRSDLLPSLFFHVSDPFMKAFYLPVSVPDGSILLLNEFSEELILIPECFPDRLIQGRLHAGSPFVHGLYFPSKFFEPVFQLIVVFILQAEMLFPLL